MQARTAIVRPRIRVHPYDRTAAWVNEHRVDLDASEEEEEEEEELTPPRRVLGELQPSIDTASEVTDRSRSDIRRSRSDIHRTPTPPPAAPSIITIGSLNTLAMAHMARASIGVRRRELERRRVAAEQELLFVSMGRTQLEEEAAYVARQQAMLERMERRREEATLEDYLESLEMEPYTPDDLPLLSLTESDYPLDLSFSAPSPPIDSLRTPPASPIAIPLRTPSPTPSNVSTLSQRYQRIQRFMDAPTSPNFM